MTRHLQNVVVPWYDAGNPLRLTAYQRVFAHLVNGGFAPTSIVPPLPWSPGKARNAAARIVLDDVLVFNDADTICPPRQIRAAVDTANASGSLVYAYTVYVRENEQGRTDREIVNPPSMGCAAIRRDSFRQVGGFDEGFVGWGFEDVDFVMRCAADLGPILRIDGAVRHLWHGDRISAHDAPDDADIDQVDRNLTRLGELWQQSIA